MSYKGYLRYLASRGEERKEPAAAQEASAKLEQKAEAPEKISQPEEIPLNYEI
jgi:hypothetical protein